MGFKLRIKFSWVRYILIQIQNTAETRSILICFLSMTGNNLKFWDSTVVNSKVLIGWSSAIMPRKTSPTWNKFTSVTFYLIFRGQQYYFCQKKWFWRISQNQENRTFCQQTRSILWSWNPRGWEKKQLNHYQKGLKLVGKDEKL